MASMTKESNTKSDKKVHTQKHPDIYKFVVDCKEEHRKTVYAYMRNLGFGVKPNPTTLGDHYGIKQFSTPEKVENTANGLINKFSNEIYQISVMFAE